MSTTTTTPPTSPTLASIAIGAPNSAGQPTTVTDQAIAVSRDVVSLATQAEQIPVVKAELQAQFDSISHSASAPLILAVAALIGNWLTQQHVSVDTQLIVVALGAVGTGAGYAWQWVSMKMRKPVVATPTPAA